MELGIATVATITGLAFIVGLIAKNINKLDNKWIPVICGVSGVVLGIVALMIGMPDFPATDYLTAAAVGGASGLAATGIDQVFKQMKQ